MSVCICACCVVRVSICIYVCARARARACMCLSAVWCVRTCCVACACVCFSTWSLGLDRWIVMMIEANAKVHHPVSFELSHLTHR